MEKALHQATLALKHEEVPIGAIVIDADGNILSRAYNQTEKRQTQLGHAEIIAISKACKKKGSWRLNGCWICVTLEPCLMCFGLIQLSRFEGIIFGAQSTLFGAGLDKLDTMEKIYGKNIKIISGVKEKESLDLLKSFFNTARKKKIKEKRKKG